MGNRLADWTPKVDTSSVAWTKKSDVNGASYGEVYEPHSYFLDQETGDSLLQETGDRIIAQKYYLPDWSDQEGEPILKQFLLEDDTQLLLETGDFLSMEDYT